MTICKPIFAVNRQPALNHGRKGKLPPCLRGNVTETVG